MLLRLYSDTNLFDAISFRNGMNIVFGKYSSKKEAQGINGIGKSSLIRLIDFALIGRKAERLFNREKYHFLRKEKHSLTLEFQVQQEKYAIKRFFSDLMKVQFRTHPDKFQDYEKREMQTLLENIFFPVTNTSVVFEGRRFGTIMEFFIKDDLENQKRIDPLSFVSYPAKTSEKTALNFYLLNLPTKNIIDYNSVLQSYERKQKTIKELTDKFEANTNKDINQFRTEKIRIENRIQIIEESLKDYNFLKTQTDIENRLTEVTHQISRESMIYNSASRKLKNLQDSYCNVSNIDLDRIQNIYNDASKTFGDFVKKSLEEIIEFKDLLLNNRRKYLLSEEKKYEEKINSALNKLKSLEKERSRLFLILRERGVLDKIESVYEELIKEKASLIEYSSVVKQIDELETSLAETNIEISELKRDIINEVLKVENDLNELRWLFQEILANSIYLDEKFENSYFNVKVNSSAKTNQLPVKISIQIPKADALGQERLKIVAYDLMVFLKSRIENRKITDFLIHDGIFHAISQRTTCSILNYMNSKYSELQNFQYIVTFNEDEIDILDNDMHQKLDFDITECIIAKFYDAEDGTLFNRFF